MLKGQLHINSQQVTIENFNRSTLEKLQSTPWQQGNVAGDESLSFNISSTNFTEVKIQSYTVLSVYLILAFA